MVQVWAAVMVAPLVTDALGAAQLAKRAKAGSKQRSGKQGPDLSEASRVCACLNLYTLY